MKVGSHIVNSVTGTNLSKINEGHGHGQRLRGNGPPKFEVGGRPMHPSPQYLEKLCYGMYEVTKKGEIRKFWGRNRGSS